MAQLPQSHTVLALAPADPTRLAAYLQAVALAEQCWVPPADLATLVRHLQGDIRACLLCLQTWLQGTSLVPGSDAVVITPWPWLVLPNTSPAVAVWDASAGANASAAFSDPSIATTVVAAVEVRARARAILACTHVARGKSDGRLDR
jgi:hypothetical protein